MTLANRITLFRIATIPVFLAMVMLYGPDKPWARQAAIVIYIIAALSDLLDGYIARNYDQKTKLGAVLDPTADKLLVNLSFVFLAANETFGAIVPLWLPVVVLGRDLILVGGSALVNKFLGPIKPRPRILGKVTTFIQNIAICVVLVEFTWAYNFLLFMLGLAVLSLVDYFVKGYERVVREDEA